jgi:serine/threonine protein kinase
MPNEAVQTTADFLRVLRASNLAKPEAIDAVVAPWADRQGPVPEELVAAVLESKLVTQWHVDQLRKGRYKGFFLGKYKLLRLIGSGGMSSVYLAEHATLQNEVAIKVLPLKRVDQTSFLARFEREARMSARLNHPNITRAFDLDTAGSIHFFVMEYVEGVDLHRKVKQEGPLLVHEAADLVRQAALGLHYAHEEGFVHRDIKPANMILDKRGTLKILDLGLGLSGAEGPEAASLTQEHDEKVLGTADFLAPEQVTDSHNVDKRADIYSLGCTLYYLLTGAGPFAEGNVKERFRKHLQATPPNLMEKRPDTPAAIASLYLRMLQKRPEARQQTAKEVADALAAWLAENPVAADAADAADGPSPAAVLKEQLRRRSAGDASRSVSMSSKSIAPPRLRPRGSAGTSPRTGDSDLGGSSSLSGIDASQLSVVTPPPSASTRSTIGPAAARTPAAARAPDPKKASAATKKPATAQQPADSKGSAAEQAQAYRRKKTKGQLAGIPLFVWAIIGVGVLVAGGLAAYALL